MAAVGLTWEEATRVCPEGVVPACHNAEVNSGGILSVEGGMTSVGIKVSPVWYL